MMIQNFSSETVRNRSLVFPHWFLLVKMLMLKRNSFLKK